MSSNKSAKQRLIELYGPECFIDKLGFRKFEKPVHYTSTGQRKRMEMLTYHHIVPKSKGGKATEENGALLSARNHDWFNHQSKENQDRMNQAFQEYKKAYKKCDIQLVDELPKSPIEIELVELVTTDNNIKLSRPEIARNKIRRKEKTEFQKLKKEYEDR